MALVSLIREPKERNGDAPSVRRLGRETQNSIPTQRFEATLSTEIKTPERFGFEQVARGHRFSKEIRRFGKKKLRSQIENARESPTARV